MAFSSRWLTEGHWPVAEAGIPGTMAAMNTRPRASRFFTDSPLLLLLVLQLSRGATLATPDIDIRINGVAIPDGGSYDFGSTLVGTANTKTFTIRNLGDTDLTNISISKTGTQASRFVNSSPQSFVKPGLSTTFNVSFLPSSAGNVSASFTIASTDPDENPYRITFSGIGYQEPEIVVTQASTNMVDGVSTVNFGRVNIGNSAPRSFTIRNNGAAALTGLSAAVTGQGFSSTALGVTSLGPGASKSFDVRFTPSTPVSYSGTLTITSNDADENPFTIGLTATGAIPTIEVENQGQILFSGAGIVTITAPVSTVSSRTFTIRNVSGVPLSGIAVALNGTSDFSIATPPPATLAMTGQSTFTVNFSAQTLGDVSTTVQISSDQFPASPFSLTLIGTGVTLVPDADEDGDGLPNFLEIATGSDPLAADPQPGLLTRNGANLEFVLNRRIASQADTTLTVEWSDDPAGTWNSVDISSAFLEADDGILQQLRYVFPAGNTGHRFVRLRATRL